jgi:hypothetical protein
MSPHRRRLFDGLVPPVSNCPVQPTGTAVTVLLAAALSGAILIAMHYRGEAASLRRQLPADRAAVPASIGSLALSSSTTTLPAAGPLAGQVTAFAVRSSARLAQIIVTARITGGRPQSSYELYGAGCAGHAADHAWAAGITDARGTADLTGHAWTVSVSQEYYLVLGGPGMYNDRPGPAVHGYFGMARGLSAVHGGIAPCAP